MSISSHDPRRRSFRLAPGFTSGMNFAVDLAVLAAAMVASVWWFDGLRRSDLRPLLWVIGTLLSTWVIVAAAIRHYAPVSYERDLMDEIAMITTMCFAVVTVLEVLHFVVPQATPLPH